MKGLPKAYDPKKVEEKIYKFWLKSGLFNPDNLPQDWKKPFSIVLPPPNVTGELHIGHALNAICQDIIIRKKRMEKFKTVWVPGLDHAGIATQAKVEKELKKEGKTRFDLGKEKFLEKVKEWAKKYGKIIIKQFQKLGCSLDWSRKRFTLDKNYSRAVKAAFSYYHKKGLIYKKERPVNWCPNCQTSLSDLEIEYQKVKGKLWYIKYRLKRGGEILVATTRPETMFGDVAIAFNPKDKRYKNLEKEKAILPILERELLILKDSLVDPGFGTGLVKVTPAHDLRDYEIALKNNLQLIKVIDEKGVLTGEVPPGYQGLKTSEARLRVVSQLKEMGLLEKEEDYEVTLPKCYRCNATLEIIPSLQWFLKMEKLAKKAKESIEKGEVLFFPENFKEYCLSWLNSVRDWCISRQIWWGHKIPIKGVEDVLDTWFSSALWPFAVFGWPKKTKDLKKFYPTNVLSTDRGILNLWVARMIFSGIEFLQKPPFRKVFVHPTVLTKEGKRMSKSLGTGISPVVLIENYGSDATRFGIIWQLEENQDIRFSEEHLVMGRKFVNKIWNASRFVLLQIGNRKIKLKEKIIAKKTFEKQILTSLKETIKFVNEALENFQFGKAAKKIYSFFWHEFCDKFIEEFKKEREKNYEFLVFILLSSLKILHPFLPFLTEKIYQLLPLQKKKLSIMIEDWPSF